MLDHSPPQPRENLLSEQSVQEANHARAYNGATWYDLASSRKQTQSSGEVPTRVKRPFPKEVTIIVRSIAEPTFDVVVFGLAEQKTILPDGVALSNISSLSLR